MDKSLSLLTGSGINTVLSGFISCLSPLDKDTVRYLLTKQGTLQYDVESTIDNIIANKYTEDGARDYLYCYWKACTYTDSFAQQQVNSYLNVCVEYVRNNFIGEDMIKNLILCHYYPILGCVHYKEDQYGWVFYDGVIWRDAASASVSNLFRELLGDYQVCLLLDELGKAAKTLRTYITRVNNVDFRAIFYISDYKAKINRHEIFCMNTEVFDMSALTIRIGLPSDYSTLKGGHDHDLESWKQKRKPMLDVLLSWLSKESITSTYLDWLSLALSEFPSRYSVVNIGTGSDGKSTFSLILQAIWGSYCVFLPEKAFSDSGDANGATPILNAISSKRLLVFADVKNVVACITSSTGKTITGGDPTWDRKLFREYESKSRAGEGRKKCLVLYNTNLPNLNVKDLHSITRLQIVEWDKKHIIPEEAAVIPAHMIKNSSAGVYRYELTFLQEYGSTFITELISRYGLLKRSNMKVSIAPEITIMTKKYLVAQTLEKFLEDCTEMLDSTAQVTIENLNSSGNVENSITKSISLNPEGSEEPSTDDLFSYYSTWRKNTGRISRGEATYRDDFERELMLKHELSERTRGSKVEKYVKGLYLKSTPDLITSIHPLRSLPNPYAINTAFNSFLQSPGSPASSNRSNTNLRINVPQNPNYQNNIYNSYNPQYTNQPYYPQYQTYNSNASNTYVSTVGLEEYSEDIPSTQF